jgi:hypothetical protein
MKPSWFKAGVAVMALAVPACRSGQGPGAGKPEAPAAPGLVEQLVGQSRVLRHRGDEKKLALKREDVARLAGDCDAVVEVRQSALQQGTLRLTLAHLGRPHVPAQERAGRRQACPPTAITTVAVSRMNGDAVPAVLAALLPTPEEYLQARGGAFDRQPAEPSGTVAAEGPGSTIDERNVARQVATWPVALFTVDADVPRPSGVAGRESEADFVGVVGTDGRLHGARVTSPLSDEHARHLQRVLGLWLYQPARAADRELPARVNGKAVLRLY